MKVLFLDVDGVMNSNQTNERFNGCWGVDEKKIPLLRHIINMTGCRIVLSSTWRKHEEFKEHLMDRLGPAIANKFIGETPVTDSARGLEIRAWLAMNPEVTRFVVVDDDRDMPGIEEHCVFTNTTVGLTKELADEIVKRMNS